MNIEDWFETMPCSVVNDIAREKRFIMFAIHDAKALRFDRQYHIIKDIMSMSRKVRDAIKEKPVITSSEGKSSPSKRTGNGKTRWAAVDIRSREDKAAIREMASNPNYILDTIVELVDDGYDLHIKRTDEGSTVRSMLFCSIQGHINAGGGLSAEAPDAWLSITALVYKHVNLLDGNWFDKAEADSEDDNWR